VESESASASRQFDVMHTPHFMLRFEEVVARVFDSTLTAQKPTAPAHGPGATAARGEWFEESLKAPGRVWVVQHPQNAVPWQGSERCAFLQVPLNTGTEPRLMIGHRPRFTLQDSRG
jgi:hypothetical protein